MKACVIGAGSSGIAAAQVLQARGIDFDCFEKGSKVGGNWRYENDNGMSSAYRSLHINTSRRVMAFKSLPMPEGYPDYPDHFQMAAYFDEVVDRFRLRERIEFGTEVLSVVPVDGSAGEWDVTIKGDPSLRRGPRRQRPPLGRPLAGTRLRRLRRVRRRADPRSRIP
jgi:cation diffusion facilitator CzcD-associated flavoprotein CzcO